MAAITVLKENVPHGPFSREQVTEMLRTGEISLQSLAFVEGLTQWTPLRDVLAGIDGPAAVVSPLPSVTSSAPSLTSQPMNTAPLAAPLASAPAYSYAATMQPPAHLVYAGFWLRFVAIVVDGLILLPLLLISLGIGAVDERVDDDTIKVLIGIVSMLYSLFLVALHWLYFAWQESSSHQATLGKRLLGIQVTDREGKRITFGRATGRYFGKILSGLALYIGFMMAGWTPRKQGLHDLLADTLVVRKLSRAL